MLTFRKQYKICLEQGICVPTHTRGVAPMWCHLAKSSCNSGGCPVKNRVTSNADLMMNIWEDWRECVDDIGLDAAVFNAMSEFIGTILAEQREDYHECFREN